MTDTINAVPYYAEPKAVEVVVEKAPAPESPMDTFRKLFPNAPNAQAVNLLKEQVPNGRLQIFISSDQKRGYIMRGITGIELRGIQEDKLKTVAPERQEAEGQIEVAAKCCVWTSATKNNKLSEMDLKSSGAGLADSLFSLVTILSDYNTPEMLMGLSAEI
jgi:hypothetical protein